MKILKDGNSVPARTYYYILDYLDRHYNEHILSNLFNKERLQDLVTGEYDTVFTKAYSEDRQTINHM